MELTEKQKEGLNIAVSRYKSHKKYTIIAGYAGVGKSTLINFIISALGLRQDQVAYVAYTGKAAEVLRHKGCANACTAHKLLYYSSKTINGSFIFKERKTLENPYKLIIVDEISMLPLDMWNLLLSHGIHVIACGDPFQIPPVKDEAENHLLDNPDIFLDEVMRQAADSEIIQLSMKIRNFQPILLKPTGTEAMVVSKNNISTGMFTWADQILVGTNKRRSDINNIVRSLNGRKTTAPEIGDKVISLENHWDILDDTGEDALVNGTIGYIVELSTKKITYQIAQKFSIGPIEVYDAIIQSETGKFFHVYMDKKYLLSGVKTLSPKQEYYIAKSKLELPDAPCQFDYGYAITVHRAQGSEWKKVLVVEERFPFEKVEHARHLYTACTRASEKLVLIKN